MLMVPGSAKNIKLLSNELLVPLSRNKYSISGDCNSMSLSNTELPSILIVSMATRLVSTILWMYKVPFFRPLMFPVICKFVFDSFLSQDAKSTREKNARIIFSLVKYFAAK
jgi:hypothetical protein